MSRSRVLTGGLAAGALAAAIGLGGVVVPAIGAPGDERGAYEALVPARIYDTRNGIGAPAGPYGADQTRRVQITGVGGVPAGATAVVLNVTLDAPSADTYVTIWPSGQPQPDSSTINARPGDLIANMVTLRPGPDGAVNVYNFAGTTQVIFDVAGYFVDRDFVTNDDLPKIGTVQLTSKTVPAGPAGEVARFTTTAPAAGLLTVLVEGHAWLDLDAVGATSAQGSGTLAICTATATIDASACGLTPGVSGLFISDDPDNAGGSNTTDAFTLTRVIPVSAGDTTLYLNALSGYAPFGTWAELHATVIWTPDTGTLPVAAG